MLPAVVAGLLAQPLASNRACSNPCFGMACSDFYLQMTCNEFEKLHLSHAGGLGRTDCQCSSCCREFLASPPPPPAACSATCGASTCGGLIATASCAALSAFGCNCRGCCANSVATTVLPPPPPPPRLVGVSATAGEWGPPGTAANGRPTSKQGACAGTRLVKDVKWSTLQAVADKPNEAGIPATHLSQCQAECSVTTECVGFEIVALPGSSGGEMYTQCTLYELPSTITHILPRPDGASCYLKPSFAAARENKCHITKDCACCHLAGPGVDFSNGQVQCEDLAFGDLRNVNLEAANLENVDLTCASLDGANLVDAVFKDSVASSASFVGATLTNADFEQAGIAGADFTGASMAGAKFEWSLASYAKFDGAALDRANFKNALLNHATFAQSTGLQTAEFEFAQGLNTAKGLEALTQPLGFVG